MSAFKERKLCEKPTRTANPSLFTLQPLENTACEQSQREPVTSEPLGAQISQACLGVCMPLRGGEAVPSDGLC